MVFLSPCTKASTFLYGLIQLHWFLAGPFQLFSMTLAVHTYVMIFIQNCTDIMSDEFACFMYFLIF